MPPADVQLMLRIGIRTVGPSGGLYAYRMENGREGGFGLYNEYISVFFLLLFYSILALRIRGMGNGLGNGD